MIMADVFAVFGTLLAVGIALPGMLLTWRLLWPKMVDRAQQRLHWTPWRSFFLGLAALAIYLIPVVILFNVPAEGAQGIGWLAVFGLMAFASLGAAGLAELLGQRLQTSGIAVTGVGATVRGAVALELAAIFPFVGWFFFIPLAFIASLGAAIFALLGWTPKEKPRQVQAKNVEEATASA